MTFFELPKVKWLHLTGMVNKSIRCSCLIFSEFNIPKIGLRTTPELSPEDISPDDILATIHRENNSPGVESFDQFSQIACNDGDKARVYIIMIKTQLNHIKFTLKHKLTHQVNLKIANVSINTTEQ